MQIDITSLKDLGIFTQIEEQSVFHRLNFTRTSTGRAQLKRMLNRPLDNLKQIKDEQRLLKIIYAVLDRWPKTITNGTVLLIDKFYSTPLSSIPYPANRVNAFFYKVLNPSSYGAVTYTARQLVDFLIGLKQTVALLEETDEIPPQLEKLITLIRHVLNRPAFQPYLKYTSEKKLYPHHALNLGFFLLNYKSDIQALLDAYGKLDAWYSLAMAIREYHYAFPEFVENGAPVFEADGLFHPLIENPIPYDVALTPESNFLFLTGANMAGKSTFIKAIGLAVFLAHLGMGVPARQMKLCYFDGLFSNIQVTDNVLKGESYFYNEVQRIETTLQKISDGRRWLVLIDELFKGTNVQDAMKCSTAVIEGLRKVKTSLFILSTHLYEIADPLRAYGNIQFRYFETDIRNNQLVFHYRLKEGVSDDRIGYLILKREGIIDLLQKL